MARKRDSTPKPAARQSPSLVGRGQGRVTAPAPEAPAPLATHNSELITHRRASAVLDTRVIYCGDGLDQLRKLPNACIDLVYIDPPFNSNQDYEVFWGESSEPRPSGSGFRPRLEDRHGSTQALIEFMRPRCLELARVLKKTGCFDHRWQRTAPSARLAYTWS